MDSSHRRSTAFAVVHDVAASWHDYDRVALTLTGATPPGLLVHAAGPTDDGFHTIDIWESEEAWQILRDRWHTPLHGLCTPPIARQFHVRHLVGVPFRIELGGTSHAETPTH